MGSHTLENLRSWCYSPWNKHQCFPVPNWEDLQKLWLEIEKACFDSSSGSWFCKVFASLQLLAQASQAVDMLSWAIGNFHFYLQVLLELFYLITKPQTLPNLTLPFSPLKLR